MPLALYGRCQRDEGCARRYRPYDAGAEHSARRCCCGRERLAALAGRTDDARAAIDAALAYAALINCPKIHVMAGCAEGDAAERCFIDNLRYTTASDSDVTFLIEPLNHHDAPGYFLNHTDQARRIIDAVGAPNLKLMFDCYHIQILGDLIRRLSANPTSLAISSLSGTRTPRPGRCRYPHVFAHLADLGYATPLGAEYRPEKGIRMPASADGSMRCVHDR